MYLKSLLIGGFKSFAKKSELEFSSSIVAIVGPNGSGKSNVAESFRFVLGEQSIKSMRGKRGEDLIFTGGSGAGKLNRASVRLVFDNTKKIFSVDFSEVILERVVYRDGTNEYLLNGSKVRLKDVIELLAAANIGASGHHIISQGEVDRILNASIVERKEMIEDALGLKIYQYKKQESERKLEKTLENTSQINALRKEIAPHISFLEKQVEKIKKTEGLREELIVLSRDYLKREEGYFKWKKEEFQKEKKEPTVEKEKIEKRLEVVKETIAESENANEESRELLLVDKELRALQEERNVAREVVSRLEGTLSAEERSISRMESEIRNSPPSPIDLFEIKELQIKAEEVLHEAKKEENPASLRKMIETIISLLKEFVATKNTLKSKNNHQVEELREEIRMILQKKEEAQGKEEELGKREMGLERRYESVKNSIEEGKEKGREAEREMFTLMNRRTELLALLENFSLKEESLKREETAFEEERKEVGVLGGLAALSYNDLILPRDFLSEPRSEQESRRKKLEKIKIRLEENGGESGDREVLKEYEDVQKRDEFLSKEITDLETSTESLHSLIEELEDKLNIEFKLGIEKINKEFEKLFMLMFGGGKASLLFSERETRKRMIMGEDIGDEEDAVVFEEGIDIDVSLPNKRIRSLQMLSGGERALTSIALLFAVSQVKPPPFIILDETDAALDEANSKKYGDMIESLSKHSQLILITHNRETMSRAGVLYGVTMGRDGISKLLSVKFEEALAVAR